MKILLVDDNAHMRRMLKSLLADDATEFVECADGADALAAYTHHHPDVVLMDIAMPKVDGLTATSEIRRVHPNAHILILTNLDHADLRGKAEAAGACGYVLKDNLWELPQWFAVEIACRTTQPICYRQRKEESNETTNYVSFND